MRFILILLLTVSLYAENFLLLSGLVLHSDKSNAEGRKYNTVIEGVGYQYRDNGNSVTVLWFNDSNGNLMPTITAGKSWFLNKYIGVGIEGGVGSKVFEKKRLTIPLLAPKVELFLRGKYMINIAYFPRINHGGIDIPNVVYTNLGIIF